jgi:glycosyltransferase involved in cell wall biosynthesis
VITSNAASLPEVVGEAAIQVDPHSPAELARAMNDVLTNPELREDLRRNGLARAKLFSWEETAQKTLAVYQNLFRAEDLHL